MPDPMLELADAGMVRQAPLEERVAFGLRRLDAAIKEHKPSHLFAMFSGGHDSLAATALTAKHPAFSGVVHVNTGIGIEETREFVRRVCKEQNWPLLEYGPPETHGQRSYQQIVLEFGFPGPANHPMMFNRLKERSVRALIREHKRHSSDRIMLSTGIRTEESVRRMANYSNEPVMREGAKVWAAPISEWSKSECLDLIEADGLPRNRVVDLLHMSGECLCGSFARPGEMWELETWFPDVAAELHQLEWEVEAAGKLACVWGQRPDDVNADQLRMFPILPLCTSCQTR